MDQDKWMLMTYYCPTHGDAGMVKPIEIRKKEISKTFLKKESKSKNQFFRIFLKQQLKILILENNSY